MINPSIRHLTANIVQVHFIDFDIRSAKHFELFIGSTQIQKLNGLKWSQIQITSQMITINNNQLCFYCIKMMKISFFFNIEANCRISNHNLGKLKETVWAIETQRFFSMVIELTKLICDINESRPKHAEMIRVCLLSIKIFPIWRAYSYASVIVWTLFSSYSQ